MRIADRSSRASALSAVIDDLANGAIAAHIGNSTRICFEFVKI